ncbi:hypothetical protein BCF11_0163 [Collimonas sp. PA-H2]|nr:hypothetical protein BCF11_0163 [Collimonas sp. PA-H2]
MNLHQAKTVLQEMCGARLPGRDHCLNHGCNLNQLSANKKSAMDFLSAEFSDAYALGINITNDKAVCLMMKLAIEVFMTIGDAPIFQQDYNKHGEKIVR